MVDERKTVHIDKEIHRKLKEYALNQNIPMRIIVNELIWDFLHENEVKYTKDNE